MKDLYAFIAMVLAIVGYGPYLYQSIVRSVTPHPYTWFVWSIISAITLSGQIVKGAGIGALPTAAAEVLTIAIFFSSLRFGFKYVRRSDTYFLIAALLGLIPWLIFDDPTISVIVAVTVDVVAFTPTFRKSWQHPASESTTVYGANVVRHGFTLLSLQTYNIATVLHSIAMITTNTIMVFILSRTKNARQKSNSPLKIID